MESTMFVCSVIDDLIGTGSGVSMASDLDEVSDEANRMSNRTRVRCRSSSVVTTTRQYPPPMMNRNRWILKREYHEGRLILKVERVKRHRHFQVRRENGRLVITIVVSEGEEQKVEVDEEGEEEEGRGVTCDEMENERGPFDGYVEMGLKAPTGSWVVRYLPPSRPMTPAM